MQDSHLLIWRDHLIRSFSAHPPPCPFRFKTVSGELPRLTMLEMGRNKRRVSAEKKSRKDTMARKAGKSVKRRGTVTRKSRKSKTAESISEPEESMSDGSETYSDTDKNDDSPPPRHPKPPRKSAEHAAISIEKHARMEAKYEERQLSKKHGSHTMRTAPASKKSLPGSKEQQKRKKEAALAAHEQPDDLPHPISSEPVSLYLQTGAMKTSTLPMDWRRHGFNTKKVSMHCISTLILQALSRSLWQCHGFLEKPCITFYVLC